MSPNQWLQLLVISILSIKLIDMKSTDFITRAIFRTSEKSAYFSEFGKSKTLSNLLFLRLKPTGFNGPLKLLFQTVDQQTAHRAAARCCPKDNPSGCGNTVCLRKKDRLYRRSDSWRQTALGGRENK